jgi:hypothetical protein
LFRRETLRGRENHALRIVPLIIVLLFAALALVGAPEPARALEAVRVNADVPAIDLTSAIELNRSDGDEIRISTAPGRDGIVRRIAVKAREAGTQPNWIVFALSNEGDEQVDRLLVAPHFRPGRLRRDLARSRRLAHRRHHGEPGHPPRARGESPTPTSSS